VGEGELVEMPPPPKKERRKEKRGRKRKGDYGWG
jgi:hypothetical protein